MSVLRRRLLRLCGVPALLCALSASAQDLELPTGEVDLSALVEIVAAHTGQRFIFDSSLRGGVTLALEKGVDAREATEILHAALLLRGFAAVPGPGNALKIVPVRDAHGSSRVIQGDRQGNSQELVTALLRVEAADARELATHLAPLIGERDQLVPYEPTNSLIVATSEVNLRRILQLVRALDFAAAQSLQVLNLRHADAATMARQLLEAFPATGMPSGDLRVEPDERTNALILEAGPDLIERARSFVEASDVPARSSGRLRVVRLLNAEAEELAELLNALSDGASTERAEGAETLVGADYAVVADTPTNSLVIRAAPDVHASLLSLIDELDRLAPRVSLQVMLLELETANTLALNFDGFLPLINTQEVGDPIAVVSVGDPLGALDTDALSSPFIARVVRDPLVLPIVGPLGPTTVVVPQAIGQITAERQEIDVQIITRAHLLAASGEEQSLTVGDNIPVPISTEQTSGSAFTTGVSLERRDVGVNLRVRPIVVSEDMVELELDVEFSSVAPQVASAGAGALTGDVGPVLRERKLSTVARLDSGSVMLLGSLPQEKLETPEVGVPFLRRIPVLGWLFRSTRETDRRSQIVIAVQAITIASPAQQRADTIQQRTAFERHALRTRALHGFASGRYALLVATRISRGEARSVARELAQLGHKAEIVEWRHADRPRFDVYIGGFRALGEMSALGVELRRHGYQPRMSVAGDAQAL